MSSDRQNGPSTGERRGEQDIHSPSAHHYPTARNDYMGHPDPNMQHSYHHPQRASSPLYYNNEPHGHADYRSATHHYQHDSYHAEPNTYRSNSSYSRHNGYPDHAAYNMRSSYDEHYGSRDDHLDSNGNHPQSNIHGDCDSNSMMAADGKHRNNSISSNTSSGSSSNSNSASAVNKHPCKFPTCGWSFKRFEHLKRHMLVHTKERPFVCEVKGCEKSFSRSDNFSAHLRTHTKKSTGTQKSDRHLMMDPMNYMGPSSAAVGAHHGYCEYTPSRSSPPLSHMGSSYNGAMSGHSSSRGPMSRDLCPSDHEDQTIEHFKASPKSSSFGLPLSRHQHSSTGMHPLDRPLTPMTEKAAAESLISVSESTSVLSGSSNNLESSVLPKFNHIKLNLKAVSNSPENNPKMESFHGHSHGHGRPQEADRDDRDDGYNDDRRYSHPDHDSHYPHYSGSGFRVSSSSPSPSSGERYHRLLGSGHDEPNPNPNGESPVQPDRAPSPSSSSSHYEAPAIGFASHFVPEGGRQYRDGHDSAHEDSGDEMVNMVRSKSKFSREDSRYRPSYSGQQQHRNGSISPPPPLSMQGRSHSDGYLTSIPMDDNRSPLSGERDRRMSDGSYNGDYHRHSFSGYIPVEWGLLVRIHRYHSQAQVQVIIIITIIITITPTRNNTITIPLPTPPPCPWV
ncbi:hypothetical protein B0O80DRAFT_429492 [Mortierella sp. GBAus27b]|nr:hypothetical protein B0O80DRAFT_429492 [Mortierella sp. GBAus27b]